MEDGVVAGLIIGFLLGILGGALIGCHQTDAQYQQIVRDVEKNMRIKAVRDGLAKWTVKDASGTVEFHWLMQNAATMSESLGGQ
ncbi:MAG: hypothetical protein WC511_02130 [Candidatus Pacearchaeota archaeon]